MLQSDKVPGFGNVVISISDVWGQNGEDGEIRVADPLAPCCFPYEDNSERIDQIRNARDYANKLLEIGYCSGIDDQIDIVHVADLPAWAITHERCPG